MNCPSVTPLPYKLTRLTQENPPVWYGDYQPSSHELGMAIALGSPRDFQGIAGSFGENANYRIPKTYKSQIES
ncbi:hypothetical protein DPMN_188507 [Dreissena polymorpha]|uniref:Uncharacterized protein n=1 Tax=Dreissena polymorpha TaxID=45954 RepID=A0A9D4DQ76_DREPO|nr:hypothetical protein DPMN_188507 [Dreissena polymorpha]